MVLMTDLELEVPCVCPSLAWLKHTASFIPLFLAAASFPPMFCYHPNVIIVDVSGHATRLCEASMDKHQ
jgi:hypothetical protein